jgi:hypothetical protein
MRVLILALGTAFLIPSLAFCQTSSTIQVGYAVITPSTPASGAFTALETLNQTRTADTLQVSVFAPDLVSNAVVPVEVSATLQKNLGIAIANPNPSSANLTLTLRRSDGMQFTTATISLLARQQVARLVTEIFAGPAPGGFGSQLAIPAEFNGTLLINSSSPVSILGLRFRGANFSTIPVTNLMPSTITPTPVIALGIGGLGALVFPQFATGGGWSTEFGITNLLSTAVTVRIDVFTPEGSPLSVRLNGVTASSFTNLVVPGNGFLVIAP